MVVAVLIKRHPSAPFQERLHEPHSPKFRIRGPQQHKISPDPWRMNDLTRNRNKVEKQWGAVEERMSKVEANLHC